MCSRGGPSKGIRLVLGDWGWIACGLVDHVCTRVYVITVRLLWEKGQLIRSISDCHEGPSEGDFGNTVTQLCWMTYRLAKEVKILEE